MHKLIPIMMKMRSAEALLESDPCSYDWAMHEAQDAAREALEKDAPDDIEEVEKLLAASTNFEHVQHYSSQLKLLSKLPAVIAELKAYRLQQSLVHLDTIEVKGGPHLGAVRRWIKWNVKNGDQLTWGTDQSCGTFTVAKLEELAQYIAEQAKVYNDQVILDFAQLRFLLTHEMDCPDCEGGADSSNDNPCSECCNTGQRILTVSEIAETLK